MVMKISKTSLGILTFFSLKGSYLFVTSKSMFCIWDVVSIHCSLFILCFSEKDGKNKLPMVTSTSNGKTSNSMLKVEFENLSSKLKPDLT